MVRQLLKLNREDIGREAQYEPFGTQLYTMDQLPEQNLSALAEPKHLDPGIGSGPRRLSDSVGRRLLEQKPLCFIAK